jgi:spore maturation protein CgeB
MQSKFELHEKISDICGRMETEIEVLHRKLDSTIKHYNFLLNQREKAHAEQLYNLEAMYRDSWKWKTGNLMVESFIRCVNFIRNPFRFIQYPDYRSTWRGYNSQMESSQGKHVPVQISEVQQSIPAPDHQASDVPSVKAQVKPSSGENPAMTVTHEIIPSRQISNKPVVAAILEEIQEKCLEPELTLLTFRPDNWRKKLESHAPEIVLVESALQGNHGSWQYKIAKTDGLIGDELQELLHWAKDHQIPSVFWFTGNPQTEENFYDKARACDYIVTNNGDNKRYRETLSHDRIISFPFGVQPKIHNPLSDGPRDRNVCFPVCTFQDKLLDEPKDLGILLNPSMSFGLDIWDMNFGSNGFDAEGNLYPEMYLPYIKGRLSYDDMLKSYHQYKVVLNTENNKGSATMVSRRVLESLACGTPVISTKSKAITALFGDTVFITETEADTRKYLDLLLNNSLARTKASVAGIRKVMEYHRVDIRLHEVFSQIKVACSSRTLPDICILVNTWNSEKPEFLARKIAGQTYKPKAVVLLSESGENKEYADRISALLAPIRVYHFGYYQNQLHKVIHDTVQCDYYAVWDSTDAYGPEYLKDYALATNYYSTGCFGKGNYFKCVYDRITEENPGEQYRFTYRIPISTLMIPGNQFSSFNFLLFSGKNSFYESFVPDLLSVDPLNFVKNLNGTGELDEHMVKPYFT